MEVFVQCIFILAICKYSLKAAFTGTYKAIAIYALGAALWAFMLYPFVIEQTVNVIQQLLSNQTLVTNGAVLTTVEAITGIFIAIYLLDDYFTIKKKRRRHLDVLKRIPGIIFPIAIVYFELLFFKHRVGANFLHTAVLYTVIVGVGITLLALLFRYIAPDTSTKLELKMLINMGILIIGLLINSTIADYNISSVDYDINWLAMISLFILGLITVILGFFAPKIKKFIKNIK